MQNCKTSARTTAHKSSKSSLLFRPAALAAILLLAAVFFVGCEEPNVKRYGLEQKIEITGSIEVVEIDSCEYLYIKNGNATWGSHKGNCKFCVARQHSR